MPVLGKVLDAYPKSAADGYPVSAYFALFLVLPGASLVALLSTFLMKETFPEESD
jgi:hypothetical protein